MKKVVLFFALAVGLLTSATTMAQTVNMSSYITLTVKSGEEIKLKFKAAAAGTPVKIVSGSRDTTFTVDNDWMTHYVKYKSDGTTMTVYGTITGFICDGNGTNLTAIDPSHNTQLTELWCENNNLSSLNVSKNTQLTRLGCGGNILSSLDVSHNTQLTGLGCSNNRLSNLDVSHNTQLTELYCGENTLSSLDVSHNTQLTGLGCSSNTLTSLDVSKNTQLTKLDCYSNTLSSLDVSQNTQLTRLGCSNNRLSNLDVSHNTQLTSLSCSNNRLSNLDVSHNTQLTWLFCNNNNLSNLDISHNTQLTWLYCHGNNFSTAALDDIYCTLPDRTGKGNGVIQPVYSDTSSNHAIVLATNKANAIAKNWKVQYYKNDADIPATTGSYECGTPHTDIAEAAAEQALTLYPNPVADVLYLSATARTVRVYNIYGIEVAHAADTDRVEVSHLPAGVYTVRADGTVAKMVKR